MDERQSSQDQDAGQQPHAPGQDPAGSGEPHEAPQSADAPDRSEGAHTGIPEDNPAHNTAPDGMPGDEDGAPLGGDERTEQQLGADTAVERDALKSLDPDDTPA
ncbi:hypothetical protein [Microbacterium arabinogalactanolyticum]|uniref:hypothetical protein n=1 Tax=Microbacterium arabinogalactanolyticum TaxID=69365 RepID=UPI0025529AAC|nr:hypothetical protein [Microbacterium arabinogalactanolyticum]GLC86423.1 hypothetical protein MIAR_30080 [Microbacterium arabinogalactanolyticum]